MMLSNDFSVWIKEKRTEKRWSQQRLGEKVGLHGNSILRYETGTQFPPLDVAEEIIKVLGGELVLKDE